MACRPIEVFDIAFPETRTLTDMVVADHVTKAFVTALKVSAIAQSILAMAEIHSFGGEK